MEHSNVMTATIYPNVKDPEKLIQLTQLFEYYRASVIGDVFNLSIVLLQIFQTLLRYLITCQYTTPRYSDDSECDESWKNIP
jgi:hypothetical protein